MLPTYIVYSPQYCEHDTGPYHPERPDRLRSIQHRLHETGWLKRLQMLEPTSVELSEVTRVHDSEYIEQFKNACEMGERVLDTPDCVISPMSFEVACLAAGGVVNAVDAVARGQADRVFCAIRPPGHHAERSVAMGFCFFNNVAIAAEYLRHQHGIERIAILDWDVHHGNGTQHHFEADPNIFFCSIHQHPDTMYPGTGYAEERGIGTGTGTTLNVPIAPGSGDAEYRRAFETLILPALDRFRPQFLLISAGFDAHRADPLAHIELSTEAFAWMTQRAVELARLHCKGRIVSILEGGYDLEALADSVQAHLEVLAGSE